MRIRDYRDGDVSSVSPRLDILSQPFENVHAAALVGKTFTFECDGVPVAVFGCHPLQPDVWQAWMHVSDDVRHHGLFFAKGVRKVFRKTCIDYGAKRVNADVDASLTENIRFAELMGFKKEFLQEGSVMLMTYFPEGG